MNSSDGRENIIEYDPEKGVYRASYDESVDGPSIAIVEVIAAIEENDPIALDPLGNAIDTDALDAVLHHSNSTQSVKVTFQYKRYRVTIQSDGVIEVLPADQTNPDTAG